MCATTAWRASHLPRGTASATEIQAIVQKTASPVSNQAIRVIGINGECNVGAGVVRRAKTAGRNATLVTEAASKTRASPRLMARWSKC